MQAGGVTAAPAPAPPNGYGAQQQQQQQQQMLLPQHHQQQLSNNSPASTAATGTATTNKILINGGRFDFDDGGTYCGGWEDGKAHGHGVCTGPKGQGAYSGSWHYGFEVSGVYMWPSGNTFEGQWQNGKRHGLGVESRGRWLYRGEWTQGFKGRYGVRQSATTNAKYEGTWANGLQDGYGSETYADGGTFQGQWMRGMRHGYGVRTSARFGMASHSKPNKSDIRNSLSSLGSDDAHNKVGSASEDPVIGSEGRDKKLDDTRGGFVLKANSDEQPNKHKTLVSKSTHSLKRTFMSGFKMRKQRSTGELEKKVSGSIRSTASCTSWISTGSSQSAMGESYNTDSNASFIVEDEHMDVNTTETYVGEWKNDKRSGYGIAERTDGLKYEGEWFANKKYGYGVTTFKDGTKEEGKYKNNVLVTSQKKKNYFLMRSAKLKERIEASVNAAHRASKIALQKADIAISRMATARGKAELSDIAADHAREDYEIAKLTAKQFAPDFIQPGLEKTRLREILKQRMSIDQKSILQPLIPIPNPVGPTSSSDAVDASSLSLSTNNLLYSGGQQDAAETTPQFRPRSHYAQPYYQSTGSNHLQQQQQQQQQQSSSVNSQSSVGQLYPRNSLTPEMRKNSSNNHHPAHHHPPQNNGYNQNNDGSSAQPPPPPSRPNNNGLGDQYPGNAQNSMYGAGARRPYGQNGSGGGAVGGVGGGPPTARQSMVDRASFSQQRMPSSSSYAPYPRSNEDGIGGGGGVGSQRRDSVSRPSRPNQYEVGVDDDPDPSLLRRNTKYVNRESLYSFQQAMSDHFDHYKRPPSRDNSVDRYSRAASRLSGGSRQSSVEKSQNQQQQRRIGDDRLPSSSSSAADKSFSSGAGFNVASAAGAKQNISSSAATQRQPQPFEDIILRQRNLGQEIVPSPVGQPKRTESLYVNPNTARKETKPKVSTTYIQPRNRSNSLDNGDDQSSYVGNVGSVGSVGRGRFHKINARILNCIIGCCFICNVNGNVEDNSDINDCYGPEVMSGNSDELINCTNACVNNSHGIDGGNINTDTLTFEMRGIYSRHPNPRRPSGYFNTTRGWGVARSRSSITENYGSRGHGDDLDSILNAVEHANMISSGDRLSRRNRSFFTISGRGDSRSSSRSADGRATTNTIPLNSSNGHSSGNSASENSSIIRTSRSRSGLRVRFNDRVSSSDDPPSGGGGPNTDHIRHNSCDSYFESRDSNQVTTSVSIGTDTREIDNAINLQVSTHRNYSNIDSYGNGGIRRNFDDHSDIARVHRVDGYESGGECCSNEDHLSNSIRDVSVVPGRISTRGNGGGLITNGIRRVSGVYVSSREVRDHADHRVRGVVIREISNNGRDSGQGTDDYKWDNDYEGFYNYADAYDSEGNYRNGGGNSAGDGRRIRRLLPSIPLVHQRK